jgi:hypothetical protein
VKPGSILMEVVAFESREFSPYSPGSRQVS